MYGGITGHGFGMPHNLGGLLLGGAYKKVSELTEAEHKERLRKQKIYRDARRDLINEALIASGKPPIGSSQKGVPRGIRAQLKHLIDAETWAEDEARKTGHRDYAEWLGRDDRYNTELYDSKKSPSWLKHKYGELSNWFPAGRAGVPMSEAKKAELRQAKEDLRDARKFLYTNSRGTTKVLKEGSRAFKNAMSTKWVQENGVSVLRPLE